MDVEQFLKHYESQPYDPVKAHEYYMKNRQLKGRSTSGLSEAQKEAWEYTKDQITTDKQSKVNAEEIATQQKIEALQTKAAETRSRIVEKLQAYKARLLDRANVEKERISKRAEAKINALGDIPKGLSDEERLKELAKRKLKIESIQGDAKKELISAGKNMANKQEEATTNSSADLDKTKKDLQSVIGSAKEAFTNAKAQIDAGYETTYQAEYEKILATIPGQQKKASSGESSGKTGGYYIWKGEKTNKKG